MFWLNGRLDLCLEPAHRPMSARSCGTDALVGRSLAPSYLVSRSGHDHRSAMPLGLIHMIHTDSLAPRVGTRSSNCVRRVLICQMSTGGDLVLLLGWWMLVQSRVICFLAGYTVIAYWTASAHLQDLGTSSVRRVWSCP